MLMKSMLAGGAALAFLAGAAVASDQPAAGAKSENTVQLATYRVSDGDQEVRIIIKDGVPEIYLNGKRVDPKQIDTANGLWRIRGEDGATKARFFMAPRDGGQFTFHLDDDGADERVVELNELLARTPQPPDAPRAVAGSRRPVLGVTLESVDEATARQLKVDPEKSILVVGVAEGSGAAEAGIKAHDIIVAIGDREQGDLETIRAVLAEKQAGDEVKVVVLREGEKKSAVVRLRALEGVEAPAAPEAILREFEEASRWGRGADEQSQGQGQGHGQVRARARVAPEADLRDRVLRERERSAVVQERVQEMERRIRTEHEAQARNQEDMHRRMVIEQDKQHELAQRLDGLRKMRVEIDAETRKEIEEAMARAAEAMQDIDIDIELPEIEILGHGEGGHVLFLPSPPDAQAFGNVFRLRTPDAPPAPDGPRMALRAPGAPGAPGGHGGVLALQGMGGGDRLAQIEERLARIEGILTGMAGGVRAGGCNCDCCDD